MRIPFLPALAILAVSLCPTARAQKPQADIDSVLVPRRTELFLLLGRTINTKTAQSGDKFHATVEVPVTIDDRVVIPAGSFILGDVTETKRAGRVKGKSQLQINCRTVILPSGVTRNFRSVLTQADGYSSKDTDEMGKIKHGGGQGGEVAGGAATAGASGAVIGGIAARSWSGAGVGAAIGAGAGAVASLLKRGPDIVLVKGATLTIVLESDVRFVPPQEGKSGPSLTRGRSDPKEDGKP